MNATWRDRGQRAVVRCLLSVVRCRLSVPTDVRQPFRPNNEHPALTRRGYQHGYDRLA